MTAENHYNIYQNQSAYPYHDQTLPNRWGNNSQAPSITTLSSYRSNEDNTYPYKHQVASQTYAGSSSRIQDDLDPYDDDNAIPMNGGKKHESTTTISPILPQLEEDQFVRDADPRKRRRRREDRDGWFTGRITWVVYVLTTIQIIVFLAEIIRNAVLTKTPIEIHPSFNPMIGPSPYVMINMGARYDPCMHTIPNVQNATEPIHWPCPNATSTSGDSVTCTLSDLCGFSGVPNPQVGGNLNEKPFPDQWWRFIVPIFIHAGFIHIGFNLLLQLTLGRDVERLIGSVRFFIVYFAAGIFGFVLGGNFSATGIVSCGCSGSLFGILAITLLDLLYTWKQRKSPVKDLLFICLDVVIAFVLGLLPGIDNFSHIGGMLMGLVLGVCLLRSPSAFSRRASMAGMEFDTKTYRYSGVSRPSDSTSREDGLQEFVKDPMHFFQDRKGLWWIWWLVRAIALVGVLISFVLLLKNFYVWRTTCHWCKYLSCLDVTVDGTNWCDVGNLDFKPLSNSGTSKRHLLGSDIFGMIEDTKFI
ncbi:hypothetical protein M433DRAFT_133744 [Acidomyces richmondensis BFW]|nr:MAG: hypothetical protein FE78DRAFT_145111 [Acidomyces sp. 'richmondensis']KYG46540.1 hypothetical protein M433DRAFT_133744 [Acidomyces richmondensis BFW]